MLRIPSKGELAYRFVALGSVYCPCIRRQMIHYGCKYHLVFFLIQNEGHSLQLRIGAIEQNLLGN